MIPAVTIPNQIFARKIAVSRSKLVDLLMHPQRTHKTNPTTPVAGTKMKNCKSLLKGISSLRRE